MHCMRHHKQHPEMTLDDFELVNRNGKIELYTPFPDEDILDIKKNLDNNLSLVENRVISMMKEHDLEFASRVHHIDTTVSMWTGSSCDEESGEGYEMSVNFSFETDTNSEDYDNDMKMEDAINEMLITSYEICRLSKLFEGNIVVYASVPFEHWMNKNDIADN